VDESVKKISDIYELIDLYCGASIAGEKVEIIVTPRKDNPNEREITIGLQGGLSRDRDTFIVKNGLLFDSQILPQIMEHYSYGDQFNPDWNIVLTTQKEATSKAVLETESGNLLYIETYNNNIFDRLKNKKVEEPEKVASITPEQKDWEKIIEYAKERNVMQDFFERGNLTDEETKNLRELLTILSDIREFVPKTRREHRNEIAKNVEILLNAQEWSEELVKIGIDRETYEKTSELLANGLNEKILGTALTEKFARLVQNERKLNLYIQTRSKKDKEFSKEKFQAKVKFAISELSKKDYFELRNASEEVHEEHKLDKKYGRNCPGAIASLKERYEKNEDPEITTEEQRNEYITYCDELLEYLEAKAKSIKNKPRKENTDIEFVPYLPNEMVETYNSEYTDEESFVQLLDRIDLCKAGRINNEKFELIIEHHPEDKNKRLVRLSLTDGVSRHDDFYFDFKNGVEFDQRINEIIDRVSENDEIKNRDEIPVNVPGEIDRTTTMLTTNEGNEILIKLDNYQQSLPGKTVEPEPIGPVGPEDPPTAAPAVSKAISLSKEDRELANYFRLNILRNAKKLPPVGLEEIERLESVNERVTALEEARRRFEDGKLTGQEYDRIYDEYRRQLATAIKNAARNKKEEREEKVEITATAKTEEEPIKKEEKSKKLNLKQEDRELADYFRKNILRNAGQLPPIGLSEIERLASVNERVAALEEARRRFEDGRLSAKEYDLLYDEFRTELSIAIKEASKENKEEAEKEVETTATAKTEEEPTRVEERAKGLNLKQEDRELAEYFRKNILRNRKQLPPVGLAEIERLASVNERVAALEEARKRFEDGRLSAKEYDLLYDEFRTELSIAIKEASKENKEEVEKKVETTATAKTEEEPTRVEERAKGLNLKQEDRELAEYFRKNILRNRKQLPPVGLAEIERLASVNERVAALEEARRRFEDGRLSAKEYDLLYDEFRTELSIAIKEAAKENKEEAEKEVETTATAKTEEEPTRVEERAKGLNLKQEDRELAEYFRKNILRNRKQLPPVGLAEIERLASVNERVAALEEARRRFEDGRLSAKEYDLLYDEFRTELSIAIKEAAKENTNNQEITPPLMKHKIKKQKNLDDEANELAQYFRYEILRNDGQLSPSGLKEIERLSQTNEKVSALEEAHKRLENGKLSQESFDRVHAHYRKYLSDQMKKSNRKNEEPKQEEKNSLASKVQHSLKELERRLIEAINKRLEVKKNEKVEKTKFDDLHDLFREYKAVTINGETKIVNRNTNEKYNPNSKDEELDIEFAAFWESIAGIKATPGDVDLGEQYAFNEEAKILFNIMDIQYNESLSRDIPIDYESMRSLFENSKHEKGEEIYERLFSNPDNREFILDYYAKKLNKKSNKDNTKKEEKPNKEKEDLKKLKEEILELKEMVSNEQKKKKEDKDINSDVIEEIFNEEKKDKDINSDVIEEVTDEEKVNKDFIKKLEDKINEVLKSKKEEEKQEEVVEQETINPAIEIRDSYEVAASYSSFERPASLKIFFVKDNPEQVEIIISNGQGNDEEVLYQKTFTPEEVMGEMLEQICEVYIEENGMTYNQTFDVPNTNKAGSITLGENDNVLQMSNAPKEYVKKLQENLEKAFKNLKKKTTGKKK